MHLIRLSVVLLAVAACSQSAHQEHTKLVTELLASLHPVQNYGRQENVGAVLREFKAEGLIPFKPQRIDYTDFYPVLKPTQVLGHDLIIVEEEYMIKYVGCCVSEGAGMVLRLHGDLEKLESFAKANKCRVERFQNERKYKQDSGIDFSLPPGSYASVSCRARDEDADS